MKRAILTTALALAFTSSANAAPFSPSVDFAYHVAAANLGYPTLCTSLDQQIVPDRDQGFAVESTRTEQAGPCVLYVARWLAPPREFGAACLAMYHAVAILDGTTSTAQTMPRPCREHITFVLNHPHFFGGAQ